MLFFGLAKTDKVIALAGVLDGPLKQTVMVGVHSGVRCFHDGTILLNFLG